MGYNGFGRLTGDEPGGLGNLNFDVGWGRLFGTGMGLDIAWLLPAAVICLAAGFDHHPACPADGPDAGGADPVGRLAGRHRGGLQLRQRHPASLLHRRACARDRRRDRHRRNAVVAQPLRLRAATALSGTVSSPPSSRRCCCPGDSDWLPWLRAAVAVGGVGAAALLLVAGRLPRPVARSVAALAVAACLAAPAAYSVATAATPHSGAIPSVGPARHGFGGFTGPADCLIRRARARAVGDAVAPMQTTSRGPRPPSGRTTRRATNWPAAHRLWRSAASTAPTLADARGVPALRRRQADPLLHPRQG